MARVPWLGAVGLVSLVAGIALGLVITWGILPVEFKNADPADLRQRLKDDQIRMISAAYVLDGDLAVAKRRLAQLGITNLTQTFDDLIARERLTPTESTAQALTDLGAALGLKLSSASPRPTPTDAQTTLVASPPEPALTFALVEHTPLGCVEEPEAAHLRIIVRDEHGRDLPNVAIQIRSENGDETIYTGLKPERGAGYADYEAAPGAYAVTILNAASETISNLTIGRAPANCPADRNATPRGWKLVFQQK